MSPAAVPAGLETALAELARKPVVVVALDFDGTLAALADDPETVRPTDAAARVLADLGSAPGIRLALVSGRPAADLGRLASPPAGTLLVGSHGAETGEVTDDGEVVLTDIGLTEEERDLRERLAAEVERIVAGRTGAWVEHKPIAVVLHTRLASPEDAKAAIEATLEGPARWEGVHALQGKDVVELPVRAATKGDALRHLRDSIGAGVAEPVPVLYAGDDVTDERAFAALGPGDVTLKVGPGHTVADHRVDGPDDVAAALEALVALRRGDRPTTTAETPPRPPG
jgi:trehalose-phosphatase